MKRLDILYLRWFLVVLAAVTILLCFAWLPVEADAAATDNPEVAFLKYPILLGILATSAAFLWALYQSWQLLGIAAPEAPASPAHLSCTKHIGYAGVSIASSYAAGMFVLAMSNALHPGLALVGMVVILLSLGVSAFATWLGQVLLRVLVA
jgi:hypothetical protein